MSESKTQKPARKTALVTGATSGIGRLLARALIAKGYDIRVILRKQPHEHPEWKELPMGVKVYVTDISSTDEKHRRVLFEASKDVDVVFHLAAATRNYTDRFTGEKVDTNVMINTNVIGTENVLQAYSDSNPGSELRFIYASSTSVYGNSRKNERITEDSEPHPHSAYAESKYMAEQVVKAFAAANRKISYTIFRIGVVYGDGYEKSFMRIFRLIKEKKIRYIGGGNNHLLLINAKDVAEAMMGAAATTKSSNKIYNLTDGIPYTQKELIKKAAALLKAEEPKGSIHPIIARIGARTRGISSEEFAFMVSDRIVSIERVKRDLGFRPSPPDPEFRRLADRFIETYERR